ncbi:hypothetical protein SEMRO_41_G025090.1 [Seminavis robusta]|uniref:Uncharacterized protein n=1 Tax=Seminavis robusta TaxID=568900 RepID=A0A9N8H450_9STRA|nr:hypothetical protein SEMRO_41_G025090.1 [Seminavis robusta]|eukprot:Sro41_g025090.1 n/a (171) ;mRNA; r:45376-45888
MGISRMGKQTQSPFPPSIPVFTEPSPSHDVHHDPATEEKKQRKSVPKLSNEILDPFIIKWLAASQKNPSLQYAAFVRQYQVPTTSNNFGRRVKRYLEQQAAMQDAVMTSTTPTKIIAVSDRPPTVTAAGKTMAQLANEETYRRFESKCNQLDIIANNFCIQNCQQHKLLQ